MSSPAGRPAVFFDRDGIVNVSPGPGYVERPEDFHLIPEFLDALRVVRERGYAAVIVTNQRGVGRGRVPGETLDKIHALLLERIRAEGLELTDILVCTAVTDEDPRRKPNPGMLFEAAERHGLDLSRSWMIGDSPKDIEAGRRAGCAVTVKVGCTTGTAGADRCVPDMSALVELLRCEVPPAEPAGR